MAFSRPAWHVAGTGAQGCLWGAYLAKAGEKVSLLMPEVPQDSTRLALIRVQDEKKLKLSKANSDTQFSVEVPISPWESNEPIERVLIACKAYDTVNVMEKLLPRMSQSSVAVILCQQPAILWEIERSSAKSLTYVVGTTMHSAYATQRFRIVHSSGLGSHLNTWFGLPRGRETAMTVSEIDSLVNTLKAADLGGVKDNDIEPRLWERMAMACGLLPLTALYGVTNGQFIKSTTSRDTMASVVKEASNVLIELDMVRSGFDKSNVSQRLFEGLLERAESTSTHFSSMSRDIRIGRKTEIEYFNGFLVRQAKELKIPTPINSTLCNLLKIKTDMKPPTDSFYS